MRVAIIHPWFISRGGGEKVVDVLATMYPQADIFTLMLSRAHLSPVLAGRRISSTFLDRIPWAHSFYQHLLPLYALAAQSIDVSGYDLVISLGGPATKGVTIDQTALHIHYCHSPVRFLWDSYGAWRRKLPALLRPLFSAVVIPMREWDYNTAQRIDGIVANSRYIAKRIATYYRRDSTVIYPPVDVEHGHVSAERDDYYLTVGRLVPGKRVDILIDACNRMGRKLLVVGTGPEERRLKALAGPTVSFLGWVDDATRDRLYARSRGFLFAADEDFGIATVEAQAYGIPAIVYGHGGSLETVGGPNDPVAATGVFFPEQTAASLMDAIARFETIEHSFDRDGIRARASMFDTATFVAAMHRLVAEAQAAKLLARAAIRQSPPASAAQVIRQT